MEILPRTSATVRLTTVAVGSRQVSSSSSFAGLGESCRKAGSVESVSGVWKTMKSIPFVWPFKS